MVMPNTQKLEIKDNFSADTQADRAQQSRTIRMISDHDKSSDPS